jgi:hypothetical protein
MNENLFDTMAKAYRSRTCKSIEKMEWFKNILNKIKEQSNKGFFNLKVPLADIEEGYELSTKHYFRYRGFSVSSNKNGTSLTIEWFCGGDK